jgi:hypothetical protein
MHALGVPMIIDGLNENCPSIAIFHVPGHAKYQTVEEKDLSKTMAINNAPENCGLLRGPARSG